MTVRNAAAGATSIARPHQNHTTENATHASSNSVTPIDSFPLAPLQKGVLYQWLVDRHSGADMSQVVVDLRETIDLHALERAWIDVIHSHEVLRTRFAWEDALAPAQHVLPVVPFAISAEDAQSLSSEERASRLVEYLRADRTRGFDLADAPSMRVAVFQWGLDHFEMVWSFHRILIDSTSAENILEHVFTVYDGVAKAASKQSASYKQFVAWTQEQSAERGRDFWRAKLKGFTAPTALLPIQAAPGATSGIDQQSIRLSSDATRRLYDFANARRVSVETLVQSAWSLLLARYSGERDVVFGVMKETGRSAIDAAPVILGQFVSVVPVRVAVDGELSVIEWLDRVRIEASSSAGMEYVPLGEIREASDVPASSALFDTLVCYNDHEFGDRLAASGGRWTNRSFRVFEQTSFPIRLVASRGSTLSLQIEFDQRAFTASSVERMLGHLSTILDAWCDDASAPIWETPLLTAAERTTILETWNDTARDYPHDVSLASLVEAQVARTPDAPAVTFGDKTISYAQLNARANQLARALCALGAGPDVLVGLCIERSIDMMVALLAIIKSGAAYMPLDPMFPRDRLDFMVEDSRIGILITQRSLTSLLPDRVPNVLLMDASTWDAQEESNLDVAVHGDRLAVVIYTSGSTGRPKGVQVSRRAMINLLWSMREWLGLTADDRLLAVTTISFDIAGVDIWLPWLVGSHTVVAKREAAGDGEQLQRLIRKHDITFLQATPITWRQLLETGWRGKADLQAVCTGEAMPPEVAGPLTPIVRTLWNLYGPTETTIWSTGVKVEPGDVRITIGRPVANTQCYILDENRQPLPAGVAGELYIAGDGLARGYLHRPDLDAERFVPNPFGVRSDERMYRTGDLARFLPDGTIECLGRTDHQVKIRGFRIELTEIEAVLRSHASVRQAVVIAREDTPGDRRLVAYVVSENEPIDASQLRAHLRQRLPDYMMPAAIVTLEQIPLTANGKVDRRALPAPLAAVTAAHQTAENEAARTHIERQLSEIWEEIFQLPHVGIFENFFDLGGYSILAVKMMARITKVFGKQLPLNALFESPTIEQLAKHIEDAGRTLGPHTLVSIQATGSRPPLFWIPGGAALGLFRLKNIVRTLGPEQPVYGLGSSIPKSLDDIATVEDRARAYIELVRRVRPNGPYCFVGFCLGGVVALEMAQQLTAAGERVAFVGMINSPFPAYPTKLIDRLTTKLQRFRYQVRQSKSDGIGILGYVRQKLADRLDARRRHAERQRATREVAKSGFRQDLGEHDETLLHATDAVFSEYQPRRYNGPIDLFISNESEYLGISDRLDPRRQWRSYSPDARIALFEGEHSDVFGAAIPGSFAAVLEVALGSALENSNTTTAPRRSDETAALAS